MLRQVRDQIQSEYDRNSECFVMQNRISWNLFDKMRKKALTGLLPENSPGTKD